MEEAPDIMTGGLEYFSALFWTQPHTWDTPNEGEELPEKEPEEDDEW